MKRLKQWIAALCMTVSMTITAFGGQWMQDGSGWWYQKDDGSYPVSCWQWIDGNGDGLAECYYFNESGYCLMNMLTPDGKWVDANGALVVGGMVQTQAVGLPGAGNISGWPGTVNGGQDAGSVVPGSGQDMLSTMPGNRQDASTDVFGGAQNPGAAAGQDMASGNWETASRAADTTSSYPAESVVWLSATGEKYHRIPNCGRMNPSKARQVSLDEAIASGYERCKNCY